MKYFIRHPRNLFDLARLLLAVDFFVQSSNIHNSLMSDGPLLVQHSFLKNNNGERGRFHDTSLWQLCSEDRENFKIRIFLVWYLQTGEVKFHSAIIIFVTKFQVTRDKTEMWPYLQNHEEFRSHSGNVIRSNSVHNFYRFESDFFVWIPMSLTQICVAILERKWDVTAQDMYELQ